MKESPIFTRTYDLLRWLIPATVKFPRHQRFVLAETVQRSALRFQERIIEAALADEPLPLLRQADVELAKLRTYLRLCCDLQYLSVGQYEHVSRLVAEVGRLLGGWIKSVLEHG
ncbi:MAG: diversity-generating retroelement protein Avd [Chloroflexi bacterium]|nr:diversity-generating retroelement protein Avd [Chloroflexota bacterium]